MANEGQPDTDTTQFFTTLAPNNSLLSYNYTLFGQLLTGVSTINQMLSIPLMYNSTLGETTEPVNPLTISSATLSSTNPNGTLIIDTTQAVQDMTSTITVTATDTANGTKTSQSFDGDRRGLWRSHRPLDQFQAVCEFLGGAGHAEYADAGSTRRGERLSRQQHAEHAHLLALVAAEARNDHELQPVDRDA